MKNNIINFKDFISRATEKKILEAIDRSEEALSYHDFHNAREFYWTAHNFYAEFGKEIPHVSNRMSNLEDDLFFR